MNFDSRQLFLKNLETIVASHNKSYDKESIRIAFTCHEDIEQNGIDVFVKNKDLFNNFHVSFIVDAIHTLCAVSFFVKYDEHKKQCYLHVF